MQNPNAAKETKSFPYAVAINPTTKTFSESGELESVIHAEKLEHYKPKGEKTDEAAYSLVSQPTLSFREAGDEWMLSANTGKIKDQNRKVTLSGHVKLMQNHAQGETQLSTEQLEVDIQNQSAYTEEFVLIESPYGTIQASGMNLDFSNQKIQLQSKVRGTHEPF